MRTLKVREDFDFDAYFDRTDELLKSVIGVMLLSEHAADDVLAVTKSNMFINESLYSVVYEAVEGIRAVGEPIDIVIVKDEIVALNPEWDIPGLFDFCIQCAEFAKFPSNAKFYALRYRKHWMRAKIAQLALVGSDMSVPESKVNEVVQEIVALSAMTSAPRVGDISEFVKQKRNDSVPSGFGVIDVPVGGWPVGQTSLVLGYTGHGKSVAMFQSAVYASQSRGLVAYCTLADLDAERLNARRIAMDCGWSQEPISEFHKQAYFDAVERAKEHANLIVYDASTDKQSANVEAIISWLQGLVELPKIVFIDYAQKLRTRDKSARSSFEKAELISSQLAWAASELRIPIVIGSQVTLGGESGADISKGGRAWEEDAGLILRVRKVTDQDKSKLEPRLAKIEKLVKATLQKCRHGEDEVFRYWEHMGSYVKFRELGKGD